MVRSGAKIFVAFDSAEGVLRKSPSTFRVIGNRLVDRGRQSRANRRVFGMFEAP